jgi:tetratricopeptide (TPR) repeat protein
LKEWEGEDGPELDFFGDIDNSLGDMEGKMYKRLTLITVLVFLAAVAGFSQTAEDQIRMGNEAYAAFDDAKALEHYKEALKLEPDNFEALWKASRALVDVADVIEGKGKAVNAEKMKLYSEATTLARKAVAIYPNDSMANFGLSAAIGKKVLLQGKKEQIDASKEVREIIDKAIQLDPNNDLAWHALGRWHRRMDEIGGAKRLFGSIIYGSIPKGSFEESEKALEKAIAINPNYGNHYLELGRTLLALKKKDQARAAFEKCLELPVTTSKCEMYKKEAQAELDSLRK